MSHCHLSNETTNPQKPSGSAKSRERAWDVVTARKHNVSKVYAYDDAGRDLLILGVTEATVKNGNEAKVEFCGRIVVGETEKGVRMKLYQVWADMSPVVNAIKG
jgi:hypothetical protein